MYCIVCMFVCMRALYVCMQGLLTVCNMSLRVVGTLLSEALSMIYLLQAKKGNNEVDKSIGNVLYGIATKLKKQLAQHEPLLVQYAAKRKIVSNDQLDGKLLINLNMS